MNSYVILRVKNSPLSTFVLTISMNSARGLRMEELAALGKEIPDARSIPLHGRLGSL